jgi:uncharacterized membrane protein
MFITILVVLLVLDMIWFKVSMKSVYEPVLGDFTFRYAGAIAWVLIAYGLNKYVVEGAETQRDALREGALFGLILYGVYNATNYATIDKWTPRVWAIDNLWGTFVCAVAAAVAYKMKNV